MDQIVRAYGKFLLEGMVLVALMVVLFCGITDEAGNRGVLAMVGAQLEVEGMDHNNYTDFRGTYRSESNKLAPIISFVGTHLYSGTCILPNFVKAVDFSGNELEIKVSSIQDESGAELISRYNHVTGEIDFAPGIYTVWVSAEDACNRTMNCTIQIPVSK